MKRITITISFSVLPLALATLLGACRYPVDHPGACALINGATRAVVTIYHQENTSTSEYVITDSKRIDKLVDFANARRDSAQPTLYTMPSSTLDVAFYHKAAFLGLLGSGRNFFFVSCDNWKGIRTASGAELQEFKQLTLGQGR